MCPFIVLKWQESNKRVNENINKRASREIREKKVKREREGGRAVHEKRACVE